MSAEHSSAEGLLVGKTLAGQKSPVKEITKHNANTRVIVMADGTKLTVMRTRLKSMVDAVLRTQHSAKLQSSGVSGYQLHQLNALRRKRAS